MPNFPSIYCSDDLIRALVDATHCSFILMAMRREDKPIDVFDVANLLSVEILAADDLLNTLLHFGFIIPVGDGDQYTISTSGVDILSPHLEYSPIQFTPDMKQLGDRLYTYVAFDLLTLRIWAYRRSFRKQED